MCDAYHVQLENSLMMDAVHGICPCAPTSGAAMDMKDLIKLLGYEFEYLPLFGENIDLKKSACEVLSRMKGEIRHKKRDAQFLFILIAWIHPALGTILIGEKSNPE